jgi:hypothetical protein
MTAASLRTPYLRLQRIGRAERGRFILVSQFLLGLLPEFVFFACGPAMALPDLVSAPLDFLFGRLGHRVQLPPYCFPYGGPGWPLQDRPPLLGWCWPFGRLRCQLSGQGISQPRPTHQALTLSASFRKRRCFCLDFSDPAGNPISQRGCVFHSTALHVEPPFLQE